MAADQNRPFDAPPDSDQLRSAFSTPPRRFRGAASPVGGADGAPIVIPVAPVVTTPVEELRFALALRGASNPNDCLPSSMEGKERLDALNTVAAESDVAIGNPRLWTLSDRVRTRVLRSRTPAQLATALMAERQKTDDPVTAMLYDLYVRPAAVMDSLTASRARILLTALEWVGSHAPGAPSREEVRRRLGDLSRKEDYLRTTSGGVFGRDSELARLIAFLQPPANPDAAHQTHIAHLWGDGGIGKSTVIAEVALHLSKDPGTVLVHFDFDRGDLDPTRSSTLDLELLNQAGATDPAIDEQLRGRRDRIRDSIGDELAHGSSESTSRQSYSQESADGYSKSAIVDALGWLRDRNRPLLLILDTIEQVEAGGLAFMAALRRWLDDLVLFGGAPEVRVVFSGRGEPAQLWSDIDRTPLRIEIKELAVEGSLQLLEHRGVSREIGSQLRLVFGGNPLVLRLAADLFQKVGPDKIRAITADAQRGVIPPELVQGVLYDRFLKHLEGPARDYAHPGLVLPEITVPLIREVLGPAKGEVEMSEERGTTIFNALSNATWLVHTSADGTTLTQRPDIRRVMLRLMQADQGRADSIRDVRAKAIAWHRGREASSPRDHAFRLYHQLMGVQAREELSRFDGESFVESGSYLRPYTEDLPEVSRTYLRARASTTLSAEEALRALPESAWARYLAGDGTQPGEGDRLVESSDPMIALDLWRRRPVGASDQPPTFVVQALAETVEWDAASSSLHDMLTPGAATQDIESIRRVMWVTKLTLLRQPGPLSVDHASVVRIALNGPDDSPPVVSLAALGSVCEGFAGAGSMPIVPERFITGAHALASETRLYLVRGRVFQTAFAWSPHLDSLVSIQRDWSRTVLSRSWTNGAVRAPQLADQSLLTDVQNRVNSLHGAPLDSLLKVLRELRSKTPFEIVSRPWDDEDRVSGVLLLRGPTPEFHRPVRQALREALIEPDLIRAFVERFRPSLTICPADLEPERFIARASKDPVISFLAITQFADWASVLGSLIDVAVAVVPGHPKLVKVRAAWQAWDRAICGGILSDWKFISAQ